MLREDRVLRKSGIALERIAIFGLLARLCRNALILETNLSGKKADKGDWVMTGEGDISRLMHMIGERAVSAAEGVAIAGDSGKDQGAYERGRVAGQAG